MEFLDTQVRRNAVIRLTSDWQVGSVTFADSKVDALLDPVVNDKDYYLAVLGDMTDAITSKDKRQSYHDLDARYPTPLEQMRFVKDTLRRVAPKIISFGMGNHEDGVWEFGDLTLDACRELKVPYGGYNALVRLNKADEMFLWHGRGSVASRLVDPLQRQLGLMKTLVASNYHRWPNKNNVRLVAQGHVNQLFVVPPSLSEYIETSYDWDSKKIRAPTAVADPRWYAVCGSLQQMWVPGKATYVERKLGNAYPLPLGCVDVYTQNGRITDVKAVRL